MEQARRKYGVSERYACRVLGQWRGTQRYLPMDRTDEEALTEAMIALAIEYGRYGYRRIAVKLRETGWQVSTDRVQRIWRQEFSRCIDLFGGWFLAVRPFQHRG